MKGDCVYLNGCVVPRSEARISVSDRGFLYGDGFFETMRIVGGRPFRLEAHLERMRQSCLAAGWGGAPDDREIREAVEALVRANGVREGYLRITVSRGEHRGALTDLEAREPTVLVDAHAMELPPLESPPPFTLARSAFPVNERSPLARHKALSYQQNLLALADGRRRGADEVYFVNTRGLLAEGAISNLFLVWDGVVGTPDVRCGLLPGITREAVREICADAGIPLETGEYPEGELGTADEVFCTNSLRGIVAVERIVDTPPRDFTAHPLTARLQGLYAALVRRECEG